MNETYLDHAATTYLDPRVKEEMDKYFLEEFGNPGALHSFGLRAKNALDNSREKIAEILNCKSSEIIFTSGGTESINLAIKGIARANKGKHIITTKAEHHAILHTCEYLEKEEGFEITYLNVDKYGRVKKEDIEKAIRPNTILITIVYANNEIGTINQISEIGKFLKEKYPKIYFHTDACQAGLLDLNVKNLNVDLLTLNGSKIYGPKGTGILYLKQGIKIKPIIHGGGQENKLRSGTENIPGIVGFAKALDLIQKEKNQESERLTKLRDKLINGILKIPKSFLNGHPTERLPNNANITILDIEGESIILMLNEKGICVSTGSACTSYLLDPSHVLLALGLPKEAAHGSIRLSLGKRTTEKDIDKVLEVLPEIIETLRKISPVKLSIKNEN